MDIKVTRKAVEAIRKLIADGKEKSQFTGDVFLRIKIVGGGCSGFSYGLEFDSALNEKNDRVFEDESWGFRVVIDKMSFALLKGSEIDYESIGLNSGFKISNPNAKSSCGCGQSFHA